METRRTHYKLSKTNKQHIFICGAFLVSTGLAMMANPTVVRADVATGSNKDGSAQTTQTVKNTTNTLDNQITNTSDTDSAEADNTDATNSESTGETNASASEVSAPVDDTSGADESTQTVEVDSTKTAPTDADSAAVEETLQVENKEAAKAAADSASPADKALQSEKVEVKEVKSAEDGTESAADKTLKDAKSDAGKLVDDQSHNYEKFVDGESKTITMNSGATVKIDNDIINEKSTSNKLTLNGAAQAGETYTVLIPMAYTTRTAIPGVPPANGDTAILQYKDDDGHWYWQIMYKFTKNVTFEQTIPLARNKETSDADFEKVFDDNDKVNYYRPYDLVSGKVKVIHDTEVKDLDIKYQLPMVFRGDNNGNLSLDTGDEVPNGMDINVSIPIGTGYGLYDRDIFGTGSINIPDFSFDLTGPEGQNIADWFKLNSDTGKIIYHNDYSDKDIDKGTYDISLEPQGNNIIRINIKNVTPISFKRNIINKDWTANVSLNVHVPKSAFASPDAKVKFNFSDAHIDNIKVGNAKFNSVDKGIGFNVSQALDPFDAQIHYHENKTYQNINAGHYTTDSGGEMSDRQSIMSELINGQVYEPGYKVDGFTNFVNKDLKNIHYALDIPDGISIYSVDYRSDKLKNTPDSLVLTLSDGTKVNLTKDQLQGNSTISLRHNISRAGYYIDSGASISKVEAFYSTVLGKSDFGVTSSVKKNGYKIESNYASGEPVKNADKLYFKAQVYSDDSANKISPTDVTLCEVYIKDFDLGVSKEVIERQRSSQAGDDKAGSMAYQFADTSDGRPNLEHPIAYIKVPANAVASDLSQITIKERSYYTSFGAKLTPKSISVVKVGDADFIKVDLSNYDLLRQGFTITVPYGNAIDAQPGAEHSPFLVVADNLNAKNKNGYDVFEHFSSDPDAKTNTLMHTLIRQEGIDTSKTSYVGTSGDVWKISQGIGMTSSTMVGDNQSAGVKKSGEQSLNKENPDRFNIYGSIINSTSQKINGAVEVVNLPGTADGKSEFTPVMDGSAKLTILSGEDGNVAADPGEVEDINNSAKLLYRLSSMDLSNAQSAFDQNDGTWLTYDQITDWSKVKSVAVSLVGKQIPSYTTLRLEIPLKDSQIYDHVNKTVYVSSAIFSQDPENDSGLPTLTIEPASRNSAKLTVVGQSTIKTLVHYKDEAGNDQYVELNDHAKTYQDGKDIMNRSDFLQSDADLTAADKALLPDGLAIDYKNPAIRNSDTVYLDGYLNKAAEFNKSVEHYFDGDAVVFETASLIPIEKTVQVERTIHYQYADGSKAADDVVQTSKKFTIHGTRNPFTNKESWETSTDSDELGKVDSPTIVGYTPNKNVVDAVTVTPDSKDSEEKVIYTADDQTIVVDFIDDDADGKVLKTVTKKGKSGTDAGYNTATNIKTYTGKNYVLVSDDTNGADLVFDYDTQHDQNYVVHLRHKMDAVTDTKPVNRTIHYQYADGTQANPDFVQTVTFTRNGKYDYVTKKTTWDPVDNQTFDSHESPTIVGYTADHPVVEAQTVKFGDADVNKIVVYHGNNQKLEVVFIDDTDNGKTLKTVSKDGLSDTAVGYNTADDIKSYKKYELVSDSTHGADLVFDHDDNVDQHYEVHLKHKVEDVTDTQKDVNRTIHYQYADGRQASPDVVQTVTFTRTGKRDLVTGDITWNSWTPVDDPTFASQESPAITGYTADTLVVEAQAVKSDDKDVEVTVKYNADEQKLEVVFIDDTTGKTLKTVTKTGPSDGNVDYTTEKDIDDYVAAHYILVSDATDGKALVFDHDSTKDQTFEVHLKHDIESVTDSKTVKRTIHYQYTDGTQASDDVVQTATFTRNGEHDLVTDETTWGAWSGNQTLGRVVSPTIDGYTANPSEVAETEVGPTSGDTEVTVVYSKDSTEPTKPDQPTQPTEPDQPTQPIEPEKPVDYDEPNKQIDEPAHPEQMDKPTKPVYSNNSLVHSQDLDKPNKPSQTGGPVKSQRMPNTATESESSKIENNKNENELPQTGERKDHSAIAGFFIGLASFITMLGFGKKRKDDEEGKQN